MIDQFPILFFDPFFIVSTQFMFQFAVIDRLQVLKKRRKNRGYFIYTNTYSNEAYLFL